MGFTASDQDMAAAMVAGAEEREKIEAEERGTPAPETVEKVEGSDADAGQKPAGEGAPADDGSGSQDGSGKPDANADGGTTPPDGQGAAKPLEEQVIVKTRFRGSDRVFDLRKEEDRTDLVRNAQLGMNYEHLRADLDTKIEEAKGGAVDDWGLRVGIAVRAQNGAVVPTVEGTRDFLKGLVTQVYGEKAPEALKALADSLAPAETEDDLTEIEDTLEEDNPLRKVIARVRSAEARAAAAEANLDKRIQPFQDRLSEADKAAQIQQQRAALDTIRTTHETEVAKYPILGKLTDSSRAAHIAAAGQIRRAEPNLTSEQALAKAVKIHADEKIAERKAWEKEHGVVARDVRPKPAGSPPKATGTGAVPGTTTPKDKNNQTLGGKEKESAMLSFVHGRMASG